MLDIAGVSDGQSNHAGAAMLWNGPQSGGIRTRAEFTHDNDPFPGSNNSNQGGSMYPFLLARLRAAGIRLRLYNNSIGGASVFQYTGRAGAVITNPTVPASVGYFSGGEMSGGTTIQKKGDAEWDPFGLNARSEAAIIRLRRNCDFVFSFWSNGESDTGADSASYQTGLTNVGDARLQAGAAVHFVGLSSKTSSASAGNMNTLQQGVAAAIASREKFRAGADLWSYWGGNAPLYDNGPGQGYVHGTLRYQEHHARLLADCIIEELRSVT